MTAIVKSNRRTSIVVSVVRLVGVLSLALWTVQIVHTNAETTTTSTKQKQSSSLSSSSPPFIVPTKLSSTSSSTSTSSSKSDLSYLWLPAIDIEETKERPWKAVQGCCQDEDEDTAAYDDETCRTLSKASMYALSRPLKMVTIGKVPQLTSDDTKKVLEHALDGWKGGMGQWPQMSLQERVRVVRTFLEQFRAQQHSLAVTLMWEIGKNYKDAASEIERTYQFGLQLLDIVQNDPTFTGEWQHPVGSSTTHAFIKRAGLGIVLCLAPYNYPINEAYAAILPALLMGNICIVKIPTIGGLAHVQLIETFANVFPPNTIHFVAGSGRATMPVLMESGQIDVLAFIGGSRAADDLIHKHPHPHRLKTFLQLEANNMAIYFPDLFHPDNTAALQNAIKETLIGTLSFNGQRCTALKLLLVPDQHATTFVQQFVQQLEDTITVGLPWEQFAIDNNDNKDSKTKKTAYAAVTPLPNHKRIQYMKELIDDAVSLGAQIMNKNGGQVIGATNNKDNDDDNGSTLMIPAVLYPVTPEMRVYKEEQFGPVVPIATYNLNSTTAVGADANDKDLYSTIVDLESTRMVEFARDGEYGQQVSIFTAGTTASTTQQTAQLIDLFSSIYGRININTQCGRGPDTVPFGGRRSSALGTMSVVHALLEMSIPTVVAYTESTNNKDTTKLMEQVQQESTFLQPVKN